MKNTRILSILTIIIISALLFCGCNQNSKESENVAGDDEMNHVILTDQEKNLLTNAFGIVNGIDSGNLLDYQSEALRQLRTAADYLAEKYPTYDLEIVSFEPASKLTAQAVCNFRDADGETFVLTVVPSDGEYVCSDTYYGALLRDRYDSEISTLLGDENVSAVSYTEFPVPMGEEINRNTSVEALNAAKITRNTHIFVDYSARQSVEMIRKVLETHGFYGSYTLFFVPDMSDVDASALETHRMEYERVSFNCFEIN